MRKRFSKIVSYLLIATLVMQDGITAMSSKSLTDKAEVETASELWSNF